MIFTSTVKSQETIGISMGSSYLYDIYYSLNDGITAYPERENWELSFSTNINDNNIRINSGAGMSLYEVSENILVWDNINSLENDAIQLRNSNEDWDIGAFVSNSSGGLNYGWGNYNTYDNSIIGSKIYVINYSGFQKKIKINSLILGVYNFTIANLDGTDEQEINVDVNNYIDKKFIYYSLITNQIIDREPQLNQWDLLFTKYEEDLNQDPTNPLYYNVTGVLTNDNLVAEYNGSIDDVLLFTNLDTTRTINTIGYDWKEYNGSYSMVPNKTFYVTDLNEQDVYKINFQTFEGGVSGNCSFTLGFNQEFNNSTLFDTSFSNINIFPNPIKNGVISINSAINDNFNFTILNSKGIIVMEGKVDSGSQLNLTHCPKGIYFIKLESNNLRETKLISILN